MKIFNLVKYNNKYISLCYNSLCIFLIYVTIFFSKSDMCVWQFDTIGLRVVSKVRPGGHSQRYEPSVLTQVPPPLQIPLFSSHSLMSVQPLPSTFA